MTFLFKSFRIHHSYLPYLSTLRTYYKDVGCWLTIPLCPEFVLTLTLLLLSLSMLADIASVI